MDTKILANGAMKLTPHTDDVIEIDIDSALSFYNAAIEAIGAPLRPLMIDMESVTYLDSSGMWALEKIYRMYADANLSVVIFHLNSNVERALRLLRFERKVPFFKSEAEAAQHFT